MHLINGRAANARLYPHDLCKHIVIGINAQMRADGKIIDKNSLYSLMHSTAKNDANDYLTTYLDDLPGKIVEPERVNAARKEEMQTFNEYNAFTVVPISECAHFTGKQPIDTRWVDVNKGDSENPNCGSRLAGGEFNVCEGDAP